MHRPRPQTRSGRIKTTIAVSENGRGIPPVTLPRAGHSYQFVDGRLVVDGIRQPLRGS